jgi:hypothetical protein
MFLYLNQILIIGTTLSIILASVVTEVIPVAFYLLFQKKNKDNSLRVIFYLLIINFINDLYGFYRLWQLKSNIVNFNCYVLIETLFIYVFYRKILSNHFIKRVLSATTIVFVAFWLFEFITVGPTHPLYYCVTYENIFIISFAIYFYYEKIFLVSDALIYNNTKFWTVSAFFVNAAGTFFLLLYIPTLPTQDQAAYYILNYIFTIIRTILLCIAMLMNNENSKE